ncbi:YkgJ family cysteine cluster protein [bacterium]|nr:YkgJ family cysteine cluster protein [bacterium]
MTLFEKIKKFYFLKILRKKYYRLGTCKRCGACCRNIYVRHKNNVIKTKEEFANIQKTQSYSFYHHIKVIGQDDFGLIFACERYDEDKKLCKKHKCRPSICRNYPSEEIFSFGAQLQPDCGYSFEPIEKFSEIFKKISKKPVKTFERIN